MPNIVEIQTTRLMENRLTASRSQNPRSVDPRDYQTVPRPLAAMAKSFHGQFEIRPHFHERDQLLFAVHGVMRVRTKNEAWIVPPDRAVYIPARTVHAISVRGGLEMRTLYLIPDAGPGLPVVPIVLEVTDLLRNLVLALIDEALLYDEAGRGDAR